jgi:flagellar biosynthetic protein FliR
MDLTPLARFALLLVRPGMIVAIAPGIGGTQIPTQVKVGLTVLIAIGLLPAVSIPPAQNDLVLTTIVAREAAIGLALGFAVSAVMAGAEFAGHLAGYQIGFSYGATIDPLTGVNSTMLATLYGSLAALGFLGINGHHMLLRALAASYVGLPIGGGHVDASLVGAVRDMLGLVFMVGVRLAAPIVIVLLLVELIVGLISRSSPSLSYLVIGYPIRILVGLVLIGLLIGAVPDVVNSLIERVLLIGGHAAGAFR